MTLVAVTGAIGAGATTLVKRLATLTSWETVLEHDVEAYNPFFSKFNSQPSRYAFHNQVHFLIKSAEKHQELALRHFQSTYLQDFTPFEHTAVYAYVQHHFKNLDDDEYETILRLTRLVETHYIEPAVLIYREATEDILMGRIQERERPSEQSLVSARLEYLRTILTRFDNWITDEWNLCPVIRIPANTDIMTDEEKLESLLDEIRVLV